MDAQVDQEQTRLRQAHLAQTKGEALRSVLHFLNGTCADACAHARQAAHARKMTGTHAHACAHSCARVSERRRERIAHTEARVDAFTLTPMQIDTGIRIPELKTRTQRGALALATRTCTRTAVSAFPGTGIKLQMPLQTKLERKAGTPRQSLSPQRQSTHDVRSHGTRRCRITAAVATLTTTPPPSKIACTGTATATDDERLLCQHYRL
eukprot:6205680-Pleurochrysis_carterae.AAC.4